MPSLLVNLLSLQDHHRNVPHIHILMDLGDIWMACTSTREISLNVHHDELAVTNNKHK